MAKKKIDIRKAEFSGFCFGVKRAIGIARVFLEQKKSAYSIGAIIHNPVVVDELSQKGLRVVKDIDKAKGQNILIPSHGISPQLRGRIKNTASNMVDATCPFVERSHRFIALLKEEGYQIIIVGEKEHPEIKALRGLAGDDVLVVNGDSDFRSLKLKPKKIGIIAQTTLCREEFFAIVTKVLENRCLEYRIFDTICNDVMQRQLEARQLARDTEAVLVVGGLMSANTRHLADICREVCVKTYHIETEDELDALWFKGVGSVAVVSGASTPDEIVDKVVDSLRDLL
ncbi:MAG: 4-hydroxy-3-methylbut-2-enyl diphosphate reductase [Candidatus Omnitrophota bacterium]